MKLRPRTYAVQWDLHAWVGVVASLLLFVIFYCGIFALFHREITLWQEPKGTLTPDKPLSYQRVWQAIAQQHTVPPGAMVTMSAVEGSRLLSISISDAAGEQTQDLRLDAASLAEVEPGSHLGDTLYELHFLEQLPYGIELAGLLGVALLVTLISGVLIHLKNLPQEFWRFRPTLRPRFSLSDAHKVLGVYGLPFTLMLGWSGAVLCLDGLLSAGELSLVYDGDEARMQEQAWGPELTIDTAGRPAEMMDLDQLVLRAAQLAKRHQVPYYMELNHVGDANANARVYFMHSGFEPYSFVFLNAVDGRLLKRTDMMHITPLAAFGQVLHGLHFARFGGLTLRFGYVFLTAAFCVVLVTGNLIWSERRDPERTHAGNRLLDRLTVGVPAGLVVASALYFAANRLLPQTTAGRADLELSIFVYAWALFALLPLALAKPLAFLTPRRWACALAGLGSLIFAAVVALDLSSAFGAIQHARLGQPELLIVDGVLAGLSLICAGLTLWGR